MITGCPSLNGKKYYIMDEVNDEHVVVIKFFDEGYWKLTDEDKAELGRCFFNKLMSIYKDKYEEKCEVESV